MTSTALPVVVLPARAATDLPLFLMALTVIGVGVLRIVGAQHRGYPVTSGDHGVPLMVDKWCCQLQRLHAEG